MTDAQRKIFNENLENFFKLINQEIKGETVENTEAIDLWSKNVSDRYRNLKTGKNPKHQLSQEHIETLKRKLEKEGLTLSEFEQSHGRRSNIINLLKEKQQNSNTQNNNDNKEDKISKSLETYSIEELKQIQAKYDEEIVSLNQKHTQKYKKLYSLSDAQYEEIGKKLDLTKKTRKKINDIIEQKLKKQEEATETKLDDETNEEENIEIIEISEIKETAKNVENTQKRRKQKNANEKITELKKANAEIKTENEQLKNQLEELQQSRQKDILDYQGDYERRLEERKKIIEEQYKSELERKTSMIELNYNREIRKAKEELETAKKALEDYKKQKDLELDRQRRVLTNQVKETRERQQQIMVKLLCSTDNVSLETIKCFLEKENIPTEGLKNSLKELRTMIPGITRVIKDEEPPSYSLRIDALKQLEQYKKDIVCPRISNVQDGKIQFVVRSDLHLNMTNSEDTLKRRLEPFMDFCAKRDNIPIIDLGDLAETMQGIGYTNWKNFNKETSRLAYKFYKNYAKVIASAPEIVHYTLLGNHDEHPYLVGVDPLEILNEYSNNFKSLGISRGSFKIGNDKIGVFHDKQWQNIVSYKNHSKEERDEYIYDYLCEEIQSIARDYIYSLFGHYHFGMHNVEKGFSVINNGLESSLLFTAEVKDGQVEKMFVTEVGKRNYQIEIYNRGNQYRK